MYDELKHEILEQIYFYEKQNSPLVYIFIKNKNVYKHLCQENKISKESVDVFNKYGQKFINVYEKNNIEYFRQIEFEKIIKKYCDTLIDSLEKSKKISKTEEKLINKAVKSVIGVNKWFYRRIDENTIRYFTMNGKIFLLDVTNNNGQKTYRLQYRGQKSIAEECSKIEAEILVRKPKETKTAIFTRSSRKLKTLKEIELEKKRKAEKIKRQKERRLEGEEARRKKKAERRKIAKAKKKEELKKQQEIENEKKKIEKATRLERIRKEQEKLKQLPQIKYGDFIIKKSTFKCIHNNHHTEDMAAAVNVIEKDGNIKLKKINVGYCKECNVFFVLESIYEELKKWYVPICKVSDVKTYYGSNGKYGMKLAQESILKQYGYNVSKTEDLSDTIRQKILAVLIDNHIVTKNDIISYLDFFVSQRRYQSKYEQAISKWEEDREFVTNYRLGEYTTYGVNAIYRR